MKRGRKPHPDTLTPREWGVLALVRDGLSNEQIAGRLEISVDGVKFHVSEILSKLNLRDRLEAARWSARQQRPRWAIALLPFALARRPLAAKFMASTALFAVATGAGLLIWGLLVTRGTGAEVSPTAGTRTSLLDQVVLFDTSTGKAKVVSGDRSLMLAKWVEQGKTFTAYDTQARAWKLFDAKGKELRALVALPTETTPYITTHLEPAPDGVTALKMTFSPPSALPSVPLGLTILDLASGKESPFAGPPGVNFDPLFSPDGKKVAYVDRDVSTNSLPVAEPDGRGWTVLRSTPSPTEPVPLQWSPDSCALLMNTLTSPSADSYEVIDCQSDASIWKKDFDRLRTSPGPARAGCSSISQKWQRRKA